MHFYFTTCINKYPSLLGFHPLKTHSTLSLKKHCCDNADAAAAALQRIFAICSSTSFFSPSIPRQQRFHHPSSSSQPSQSYSLSSPIPHLIFFFFLSRFWSWDFCFSFSKEEEAFYHRQCLYSCSPCIS